MVPSPSGRRDMLIIIVVSIVVSLALSFMGYCFLRKNASNKCGEIVEDDGGCDFETTDSVCYDLATIGAATNNFSDNNKIGKGGFGTVYKGTLPDGQVIAVKRLSISSLQGAAEFRNEAALVAKLQHRNLLRLIGFCLGGQEKILVYEYIPNKSLDHYLFDFGMAKIIHVDQTQAKTRKIVGTFVYMSPEYTMRGQFSSKSDVYSFGVLILKILSGKKNSEFYQSHRADDLLSCARKTWRGQKPLELLDPTLRGSYSRNEAMRCIHIGLLCMQENPAHRPSMATILLVLNSYSMTLPSPRMPATFMRGRLPPNR